MRIQFDYTQQNEVISLLRKYGCTVISQKSQLFPEIEAGVPEEREQEVLFKLKSPAERRNIHIIINSLKKPGNNFLRLTLFYNFSTAFIINKKT